MLSYDMYLFFHLKEFFLLRRLLQNTSFLVIVTYILMQLSTGFIAVALLTFTDLDEYSALIFPNIGAFLVGLILIWYLLRHRLRKERQENPITIGRIVLWSVIGFFLAYGSQIIAATIEMQWLDIQPGSENTQFIVELAQVNIWFILLPAIIGPIIEELVFRKVIFGALRKWMNIHVAAIIGALIFSVVHLDLEHTLIYFAMGLVFTFLYVQTKRIIVPIIAHMSMNTLVVVAQVLIGPENLEDLLEQLEQMQDKVSFFLLGGWF